MAVLTRVPVSVPEVDGTDDDFAKSAKSIGYKYMGEELERNRKSSLILRALKELEIRPFDVRSVQSYKRSKLIRERTKDRWIPISIAVIAGIIALATFAIEGNGFEIPLRSRGLCAVVNLIGLIACSMAIFCVILGPFHDYFWHYQDIDKCNFAIPEFAVQTALDITEKCQFAKFEICYLAKERPTGDPFLVLVLPDWSRLYLEVWNEPGFKQVREV